MGFLFFNIMLKIVLLGSGNVASCMAGLFCNDDFRIVQIYSRNKESASNLATSVNAEFTTDINKLSHDADVYMSMLSDEGNMILAKSNLNIDDKLLLHTSGSLPTDLFAHITPNCGVMYPLQSFSKNVSGIDFKSIPICVSATNDATLAQIKSIANSVSQRVFELSDDQRKAVHISGVFANNFMNHCVAIAQQILQDNNLPTDILNPILKQSVQKIIDQGAKNVQTGPAIRRDFDVIRMQIDSLQDENMACLYRALTQSILKMYYDDKELEKF